MSQKSFEHLPDGEEFLQAFHKPGIGHKDVILEYNKSYVPRKYIDTSRNNNYQAPQFVVNTLAGLIPDIENAKVLDLAAGTGFVGVELHKRGFRNFDAHDGAEVMLESCRKAGVYQNIFCCFIGDDHPLPMEDDTYDAMSCSGATIENHLPPSTQNEIIRVIKPGGFFVNAYRADVYETEVAYANQWREEADRLEKEGKWTLYGELFFTKYNLASKGRIDIYQIN